MMNAIKQSQDPEIPKLQVAQTWDQDYLKNN